MSYVSSGSGPPMIVLGAVHVDHGYLRPWMDALGEVVQLIYVDQRGTGRSARLGPLDEVDHRVWVDDVEALRAHLGLDSIFLFGHSYGGFFAQEYALRYGERLRGLVLCGTTPVMDYPELLGTPANQRGTPEQVATVFHALSAPVADDRTLQEVWGEILPMYFWDPGSGAVDELRERSRCSAEAYNRAYFACLPHFDTLDRLGEIDVPTLVVGGRHDWVMPPAPGPERLHAGIPGSTLRMFERSGHFPFVEEQPEFVAAVGEWVRDLSPP